VVRNNYFHHIEPQVRGEGFHETMGIYLDAAASGLMMYGNIFHRVSIAIFINGGRDNTVDNNIFVECNPSIMVSALGIGWANKYITRGGDWAMYKNLEAMPYTEPPWSEKYPRLANIFDGNEIFPEGNIITHNVSWNGRFSILLDGLTFEDIPVKENVIGDEELVVMSTVDRMETTQAGVDNTNIVNELKSYGNIVTAENPGFHNTEFESVEDFQLAKESPAWDIGFQQIPVDSIGLYVDEYRTSVNK
jgi:parallel beta-helix repeat protein